MSSYRGSAKATATWITFLGVAGVLGGATSRLEGQPVITHPITLNQISWDMEATGTVPDSEYGHVQFEFAADPTDIFFVNIVARLGGSGTQAWIVQNLPVLSAEILEGSSSETGREVDLSLLGVTRGAPILGEQLDYTVVLTLDPLLAAPPFSADFSTTTGSQVNSFGGDLSSIEIFPGLLDVPIPPDKPAWDGSIAFKATWRFGMPNGEQGKDQCGPGALTNSIHWLAARFPTQVDLGTQTWNDTLLKFKDFTNWLAPTKNPDGSTLASGGISQRDAIEGKLRFAEDNTKTFSPDLNVKYQADGRITDLGVSVTVGERTAWRQGASTPPTFAWVLSQLQAGADIEFSIDWLDNNGNKTGGHVASVVGALRFGNKMFLWTNDDGEQEQKTGDPPLPPANGGLRTNLCHQVTIENGGYMRLSGYKGNNRIKATYSETLEDVKPQPNVCGDDVVNPLSEQCDGTDDDACPGRCLPDCTCAREKIPTVSEWGLMIMTVLLLTAGTVVVGWRRRAAA